MQEQSPEDIAHKVPVAVRILPPLQEGAPFSYIINEIDRKIQLYISGKGTFSQMGRKI